MPNKVQVYLNLESEIDDPKFPRRSIFQVADVTRPRMFLEQVCVQGLTCVFSKDEA